MKRLATITALLVLPLLAAGLTEPTLQELVTRAEAARPQDQPGLYVDIAEREFKAADQLYTEGKVEEAAAAVRNIVTYSERAHDASVQSGKRLKNTEIALRKLSSRLSDLKRTLNFEDQAPVGTAAARLQRLSDDLLAQMFGNKKK
jgi:hypothetical protein